MFLCLILHQFTASFKNAFSDLFLLKQKDTMILKWQEDINVAVIIAISSKKLYIMSMKSTSFPHEIW